MIVNGKRITPEESYRYITNGEVWSELIFLGRTDSISNWHDTNDEPPEAEDLEAAAEADYLAALAELGVSE